MNLYPLQALWGTVGNEKKRFTLALSVALACHGLIIFGIGLDMPSDRPIREPVTSVNITLLAKPGGNPDTAPQPRPAAASAKKSPAPTRPPDDRKPPVVAQTPKADSSSHQTPPLPIRVNKTRSPAPPVRANPRPVPATPPAPKAPVVPTGAQLHSQGLQMARLDMGSRFEIGDGAREKTLDPTSMTTVEDFYLQSWRRKVERVGSLNFPEVAKGAVGSSGPVLDVALRSDGTVHSIRLVRSSGHEALDGAARRIVELAAPFAPFPEALRRQYDILHIVRKWRFEQGRLLSR